MSDIDTPIEMDELNNVMAKLKKPLYKRRKSQGVSPNDEIQPSNSKLYGITVNIQPTKFMNKKQWKQYNHDQQMGILSRVEKASRKGMPSIELKQLNYEVCPSLDNIHFHALYAFPPEFKAHIEAYYARVVGSTGEQTKPWRYLDIKEIKGTSENWLIYIKKDESK